MDKRLVSGPENNKDSQQKQRLSAIFKDFTDLKRKLFVTYNYNKTHANKLIKTVETEVFLLRFSIAATLRFVLQNCFIIRAMLHGDAICAAP